MQDTTTTIESLKELVDEFVKERDWRQFHSPKNMSMALAAEAAELMELYLWCESSESKNVTTEKQEAVSDEIADILYWVLHFSSETGIDLSKALQKKMIKTGKKYPIEKCKGRPCKYTEL